MAAAMHNTGQIYAYDATAGASAADLRAAEARRRPRCPGSQVRRRGRAGWTQPRFDLVLIDASCTGTGAWRRRPDAKWRLKPANLAQRQGEQGCLLALGASMVKPSNTFFFFFFYVLYFVQFGVLVAQQVRESEPVLKDAVEKLGVKVVAADYALDSGKVNLLDTKRP